ncbi:MAG TPA: alpha/beta fold hydrolase [Chlamydiales bacterium]|nr:alpha/beta fold hydrolase [Chlamydiales bacterium]
MKHFLSLLATTKNHNRGNAQAAKRISEIYQRLKEHPSTEEANRLILEALQLKNTPAQEIQELLSQEKQPFRLFCFPYAGGNQWIYEQWQKQLPPFIKVHPIEYPGRGMKAKESLVPHLPQLLAHLEQEISTIDGPFGFFGHSLGAILAFELALVMHNKYGKTPKALFLSGSPPPNSPNLSACHEQSDAEFIATLKTIGGIPPGLLESKEFTAFFLPILRNDFALLHGYDPQITKAPCPLVIFGSDRDPIVSVSDIAKWADWTEEKIELHLMTGDHFFIHEPKQILHHIAKKICP